MDKKTIEAGDIYLAPEEKIQNAEEIVKLSSEMPLYKCIIEYDPIEKETLLTELEKIGCDGIKYMDFANCLTVFMSSVQIKATKALDCVKTVERDYDYRFLSESMSEGELGTYLSGENPNFDNRGEVKLAIFDTGVSNVAVNGSVSFSGDSVEGDNSHGTQMAGIISSVISDNENRIATPCIYSVGVADHRGFAKTSAIMEALDWAINNEIKIISMSFGDYHESRLLEKMINRAYANGIIMVAAAGNDGDFKDENRIMYPAAFTNVLSVGAKTGEKMATYSNGGNNVDCVACGMQNTVDVNGNPVNVRGTSGAAAFVAGAMLKKWCSAPEKTASDVAIEIKSEMSIPVDDKTNSVLTETTTNDIINNEISASNAIAFNDGMEESADNGVTVLNVEDDSDSDCSLSDRASAIRVSFFSWETGCICCPGEEAWFKFTTKVEEAHPNGSKGWYGIRTQGSLDTIGYLYDSQGNQIDYDDASGINNNFLILKQLEYNKTYYVKVITRGDSVGEFSFKVDYGRDDHANTADNATTVAGVYYEDKSVTGYLHSYDDIDYYTFIPARSCVMEIYTEGDTDTSGRLTCESGGFVDSDKDSNGNGNFKITAHLEGMKRYYIAVSHNSSTGYGDYTLRFKFVKDYGKKTNVISATWYNDTYDPLPYNLNTEDNVRCKIWLNHGAAYKWYYDVVTNAVAQSKLTEFTQDFSESLFIDYLISKLPFNTNYIVSIGASVLLGMLISTGNPTASKEQFLDAYMSINPSNSEMAYVCGTAATLVDYYPIVLQPIGGSERDIMGYEYDDFDYFYGLPYCRGYFIYKHV